MKQHQFILNLIHFHGSKNHPSLKLKCLTKSKITEPKMYIMLELKANKIQKFVS